VVLHSSAYATINDFFKMMNEEITIRKEVIISIVATNTTQQSCT
jgi:hypothetical protein